MRIGLSQTVRQGDVFSVTGRVRVASRNHLEALDPGVSVRWVSSRKAIITWQNGEVIQALATRCKRGFLVQVTSGNRKITVEERRDKHALAPRRRRALAFAS